MKKAILLVLVFVLVFAFAAPAFAVDTVIGTKLTVSPSIMIENSPEVDLGSAAVGDVPDGEAKFCVTSNCSFTQSAVMGDLAGGGSVIPGSAFTVSGLAASAGWAPDRLDQMILVRYNDAAGLPFSIHAGDYTGILTVTVLAS